MSTIIHFFAGLEGWLLLLCYLALAVGVVFSTKKISDSVDHLDKLTKIGGALIGGIFLAAVTSLPELITSISSIAIVNDPDLIFGNILGSNLFNMLILAIVDIIFIKLAFMNQVKTMKKTNFYTILMYLVIFFPLAICWILNALGNDINLFVINGINVSIVSVVMIIIYIFSIKALAKEKVEEIPDTNVKEAVLDKKDKGYKDKVRQEIIKFISWSLVLVLLSVFLTIVVDAMAAPGKLVAGGLGGSFAGAIFLASATSLPETTAVIQLVRLRNYDAAVGNIIGSNVFNFTIISLVDIIFFWKANVFTGIVTDKSVQVLLICGLVSALTLMYSLVRSRSKNKFTYILPSIFIVITYIAFLAFQTIL